MKSANGISESEVVIFNRIYRQHVSGLTGYARKFVSEEEAADIVHDVFATTWDQRRFLMPADEIRFFLYRCVLNACKNHLKHLSRTNAFDHHSATDLQLFEIDFLEANIEATADEHLLNKVYRNLDKLPPKCREVFEQSYLYRKKSDQIAFEMDISRRTVEAQLYKALRILRETLLSLVILLSAFAG